MRSDTQPIEWCRRKRRWCRWWKRTNSLKSSFMFAWSKCRQVCIVSILECCEFYYILKWVLLDSFRMLDRPSQVSTERIQRVHFHRGTPRLVQLKSMDALAASIISLQPTVINSHTHTHTLKMKVVHTCIRHRAMRCFREWMRVYVCDCDRMMWCRALPTEIFDLVALR